MELQRTASLSGPLSPAYTGQVPYNYNQLEGRFKQLQGKRPSPGQACPAAVPAGGTLRPYENHMGRDPGGDGRGRRPQPGPEASGCPRSPHSAPEGDSFLTVCSREATIWSPSLRCPFYFPDCQVPQRTHIFVLQLSWHLGRALLRDLLPCRYLIPCRRCFPAPPASYLREP